MRNPQVEQMLNEYPNAIWEYRESIPVASIDRKKSHDLQVRVGHPILTDKKEEYTLKARNGVDFPALVCYMDGDSFVNLDGNQRTEGFLAARVEATDAYVVLTDDPAVRTQIAYRCNTLNGAPPSEEDNLVHARALVTSGMRVPDVAQQLGLSATRIHDAISDYDGHVRAKSSGVQTDWNRIESKKNRCRIHNGIKLDSVFTLFVKYAANFKMTSAELSSLVNRVTEYNSEADQLNCLRGVISSAEKARKDAAGRKAGNTLVDNPINVMRIHLAYWPKGNHLGVIKAMTADEREEIRPRIQDSLNTLNKMMAELG